MTLKLDYSTVAAKLRAIARVRDTRKCEERIKSTRESLACDSPVTGADPEILKGGCTKFSGPELPYSGFDPFLNLL